MRAIIFFNDIDTEGNIEIEFNLTETKSLHSILTKMKKIRKDLDLDKIVIKNIMWLPIDDSLPL